MWWRWIMRHIHRNHVHDIHRLWKPCRSIREVHAVMPGTCSDHETRPMIADQKNITVTTLTHMIYCPNHACLRVLSSFSLPTAMSPVTSHNHGLPLVEIISLKLTLSLTPMTWPWTISISPSASDLCPEMSGEAFTVMAIQQSSNPALQQAKKLCLWIVVGLKTPATWWATQMRNLATHLVALSFTSLTWLRPLRPLCPGYRLLHPFCECEAWSVHRFMQQISLITTHKRVASLLQNPLRGTYVVWDKIYVLLFSGDIAICNPQPAIGNRPSATCNLHLANSSLR